MGYFVEACNELVGTHLYSMAPSQDHFLGWRWSGGESFAKLYCNLHHKKTRHRVCTTKSDSTNPGFEPQTFCTQTRELVIMEISLQKHKCAILLSNSIAYEPRYCLKNVSKCEILMVVFYCKSKHKLKLNLGEILPVNCRFSAILP